MFQCPYECNLEIQMKNHEIRIHGEKTVVCSVEGCNKMFAVENDMKVNGIYSLRHTKFFP